MKILAALVVTLTAGTCTGGPDVGLAEPLTLGNGEPDRGAPTGTHRPGRMHAATESSHSPVKAPHPTTTTTPGPLRLYERGPHIVALQVDLGLRQVDGIYGPVTRAAHMATVDPVAVVLARYPHWASTEPTGEPGDSHHDLPTLADLIVQHFEWPDRRWAYRVAFCESSGLPDHTGSDAVSAALAVGWFQHLAKYWDERAARAGLPGAHPFDPAANVAVAAWLFYDGGGARHWNESKPCWEEE